MELFNEEVREQLKSVLGQMQGEVTIELFTTDEAYTGSETVQFMEEFTALSDKLSLVTRDLNTDKEAAGRYGIERAPSFVILNAKGEDRGIRFSGLPAGYEINSFVSSILEQSGLEEEIPAELKARIEAIDEPVNIKVFVTLSCPHCPQAVQKAHKIAMLNPKVTAEMIEASTFDELSNRFNVSSVPQIVFNDSDSFLGNQPFNVFVDAAEAAVK